MDLRALPFAQLNCGKKEKKRGKKKKGLSVFLSFCRSCPHLTFVRDDLSYLLVSLNLGFLSFFRYLCAKTTLVDYHLEGGMGKKKNQCEKLLSERKVTWEPRCKRTRCLFLLISFLWRLSWQHIETFPLASYRLWTSSWQSAPFVWTHDLRTRVRNYITASARFPLESGEITLSLQFLFGVWCRMVMSNAVLLGCEPSLQTPLPHSFLPPHPPSPSNSSPSGICTVTEEKRWPGEEGGAEGHCKVGPRFESNL